MSAEVFKATTYMDVNYVQQRPWGGSGGSIPVYCPKLMPMIGMGIPKSTPASLNKSIFANAKDCAVTIPSKISTQNYFTALPPLDGPYKHGLYDFGTAMRVESYDKDMQSTRLTTQVDNSTTHP